MTDRDSIAHRLRSLAGRFDFGIEDCDPSEPITIQDTCGEASGWKELLIEAADLLAAAPSAPDEALREIYAQELEKVGDAVGAREQRKTGTHPFECVPDKAAIAALRRVSFSAPREDVYRAALEEIASGLSTRNPYDIANEALK